MEPPDSTPFRIGLVQMCSEKGAINQNLRTIAGYLHVAQDRCLDITAFPKMSISGYADPDRFPQAVLSLDGPEVKRFLEITRAFSGIVLAGLIEANPSGKPYITQVVARQGLLLGFYRKITIIDEETAWFSPGAEAAAFDLKGFKFGLAICADIHNEAVFAACASREARVVFVLAAPGLYGEQTNRNWQAGFDWWRGECRKYLSRYARSHNLWIAVATQSGRTVDEDFPGGGFVFSPQGGCLYASPDGSPEIVLLGLDLEHETVGMIEN